jgi:ribose-phosphate pyrophosphokinase
VLSGDAVSKIAASGLDELVVSDSIPLSEQGAACPNIRQLSIAEILAETMRRVSNDESVSELFVE